MVGGYRHPCVWGAQLVCPGQTPMGKPMAQVGTGRQLFSCWSDLAGAVGLLGPLCGMGVPLFLGLLINYLVISQNEGAGLSTWPDLTYSALLLKDVGSWRRGWHNFPSLLWAIGADSRCFFNTYLGPSSFDTIFNLCITLTRFWISLNQSFKKKYPKHPLK